MLAAFMMIMSILQAQSDEEFLAETFLGGMDGSGRRVYVEISPGLSELSFSKETDYRIFREEFGIWDTAIVDELHEYEDSLGGFRYDHPWNAGAPVFREPRFRKLRFVDSASFGRGSKHEDILHISKPLFTRNRRYALVSQTYYSQHRRSLRARLKSNWKWKYQGDVAGYNILFRYENGKWTEVGRHLTIIS